MKANAHIGLKMSHSRKRDNMDGETAIAFAAHRFEQLHARESCPEWLPLCTSIGYHWDSRDQRSFLMRRPNASMIVFAAS